MKKVLILFFILIFFLKKKNKESMQNGGSGMLNIYNSNLQKCRKESNSNDMYGSWDREGYCSELESNRGIHQICLEVSELKGTANFSNDTGQSNWSEQSRLDKNHCMCLGAYSLFKYRQKNKISMPGEDKLKTVKETSGELNCKSIRKEALTPKYFNNWNSWNGHENKAKNKGDNIIISGVESLVNECYNKNDVTDIEKENLIQNYCEMAKNFDMLQTEFYKNKCINI